MTTTATTATTATATATAATPVLSSVVHEVPADQEAFDALARERGWSDGLPLVPPTAERVARHLAEWGTPPDEVIGVLPPSGAAVTAEKLAVNAVMAGAPAAALPLLRAAVEAVADPGYELHALNATTGSVTTALIVNGAQRHALGIPFGAGCLGGADGRAASIGRALQLVMRNVAGQRVGVTSQSTFGQPGRVSGIVFGEWEERSPWAPLAQRRGVPGDAVTAFGTMGTANICEVVATDADVLLEFVGRALAHPGANGYLVQLSFAEVVIALNPVWAALIGKAYPEVDDVRRILWEHASIPLSEFPRQHQRQYEEIGWVDARGRVPLTRRPEDVIVMVAGGLGGLHGAALHSWGTTITQTRLVRP
ncbi:hypothetical protein [Frankia sp. QA3]|uniref:hypothetical protein n=1 Tax=Frankia sp. QA3 TaxID=710111 RepID=UPI000269C9C3|nr:hypothetical protein [Frankia sp. QA3]EIV94692.1 hypothetical protein FraQA3DRAFT_4470 [Frankia sp. QA3]